MWSGVSSVTHLLSSDDDVLDKECPVSTCHCQVTAIYVTQLRKSCKSSVEILSIFVLMSSSVCK